MSTPPSFSDSLAELQSVLTACGCLSESVAAAGEAIVSCLRAGNKLITCGNGGSAADALHLSEELVGRYQVDRPPLPAICLSSDVTALTCIANDYGYDQIFARQVRALGKSGDVFVGFTTSGNSPNVLAAFEQARARGLETILLSGKNGGKANGTCDHEIIVPSANTARIQEVHTLVLHQWLEGIDACDWDSAKW
ncbi:MAG: SIS domain-containing protein [Luteolibacter sp.]